MAARYVDELLRAGSSRPPLEILSGLGVDLAGGAAVEKAVEVFERLLADMERHTGSERVGR